MRGGESFGERILREMLENITGKETYMNEMAKKLREAVETMKGAFIPSTYAISLVRKALDVESTPTSAGDLGAALDVIADELDVLQAQAAEAHNLRAKLASAEIKATRRKNHAENLSATVTERNARLKAHGRRIGELKNEVNELRKQVPSEKERQILDMWPRFEDGEPVMFGDEVDGLGGEIIEVYIAENAAAIWNNSCSHMHLGLGKRVKRSAPEALDADGVEIKVGDTVWHEDGSELRVIRFGDVQDGETMLGVEYVAGPTKWGEVRCLSVTHTSPDSWERLEEDTMKGSCAYFGFADKPCSDGDGCPANKPGDCAKFKAVDIVRRAKALAGVEVSE